MSRPSQTTEPAFFWLQIRTFLHAPVLFILLHELLQVRQTIGLSLPIRPPICSRLLTNPPNRQEIRLPAEALYYIAVQVAANTVIHIATELLLGLAPRILDTCTCQLRMGLRRSGVGWG